MINVIINYLKNIGYIFAGIFVVTIIITILNYFNILNGTILKVFRIITIILSLFIGGYLTGLKANKKGYLEGIKFGSIMIIIVLLLNLLVFNNKFTLMNILYYLLLLFCSTLGSMICIMRKSS